MNAIAELPIDAAMLAAQGYAQRIGALQQRLTTAALDRDNDDDLELLNGIRALTTRIDINPLTRRAGGPVGLTLHGDLAPLLSSADGIPGEGVRERVVVGARFQLIPNRIPMVVHLTL